MEKDRLAQWLAKASYDVQRGLPLSALSILDRFHADFADDGSAWQLRGLAEYALGHLGHAQLALERASFLVPLDVTSQCALAKCYLMGRRKELALCIYSHLAEMPVPGQGVAEEIGEGLLLCGELDSALSFCRDQSIRYPKSDRLASLMAQLLQRLGKPDGEVLPYAYHAFQLRVENAGYLVRVAQLLTSIGRTTEARDLISPVDMSTIQCIPSLERLRLLCDRLQLTEQAANANARLQQIGYELSSGYRPQSGLRSNDLGDES